MLTQNSRIFKVRQENTTPPDPSRSLGKTCGNMSFRTYVRNPGWGKYRPAGFLADARNGHGQACHSEGV